MVKESNAYICMIMVIYKFSGLNLKINRKSENNRDDEMSDFDPFKKKF